MTFTQTLHARLESLAYKLTDNFCYSCYKVVEGDTCPDCFTDDFMRHLKGVGVEYGSVWIAEHLIREHCQTVDGQELYEQMLNECYELVSIGSIQWNPGYVLKELDPTAFRCGASDYLANDNTYVELYGDYYLLSDIDDMLEELETDI